MKKLKQMNKSMKISVAIALSILSVIVMGLVLFGFSKWMTPIIEKSNREAAIQQQEKNYQLLHPAKKTLTMEACSKTFTPDDDYDTSWNMSDDDNINLQIQIYLRSITNLKDYKVNITTTPETDNTNYIPIYTGKSMAVIPDDDSTPLTKVVTLTKK